MRNFILVIVVLICGLFSCLSKTPPQSSAVGNSLTYDTLKFVIIPFDSSASWLFKKNYKSTTSSANELQILDSLLKIFVNDYDGNLAEDKVGHPNIDFPIDKYRRQYISAISSMGEKEVWVNCFCENYPDWQKQIIIVDDGGSCFLV